MKKRGNNIKKLFLITIVMALCIMSSVSVYAAYENYTSSIDISSNSSLVGAKRAYSSSTYKLELSDVTYYNDYTTHKAKIGITDGNSVLGYNTLGSVTITLPSVNGTSTYTIGTFTSGNRCYSVETKQGTTVYDGFTAESLMWTQ